MAADPTSLHQDRGVKQSDVYDDTLPAGSTLESSADSLQFDENAMRSQLRRIIDDLDWKAAPSITLLATAGHVADGTIHFTEGSISHLNIADIGVNSHASVDTHIADATVHFTEGSIDHTAIQNIGANSHAAIDTHIADVTIHFTEGSISHLNIGDIGVNSHAAIDTHIADVTIHFTEGSIDHTAIQNIGVNSHAAIDTHIADATIHFTEGSISHLNIQDIGVNSHAVIDTHLASVVNPHTVTLDQAYVAGSALLTLTGLGTLIVRDTTVTSASTSVALQLDRTGGSLAVGDGIALDFSLNSDAGTMRDAFRIASEWGDPTDGAEFSEVVFSGRVGGIFTEALRFRNAGLATAIVTPLALNLSPNGDVDDGVQITTIANDVFIVPFNPANEFFLGNTVADPSVDLDRGTARAMSLIPLGTTLTTAMPGEWVNFGSTVILDYVAGSIGGLISATGTFEFRQAGNGFGAGNLFKNAATFKNENAVAVSFGSQYTFVNAGTYQADAASISSLFWRNCLFQTQWNVINAGTLQINVVNAGGFINPNLGAGVNFTNMRDWEFAAGTFAGTVTNRSHLYFAATNTPAVTIFSGIQSLLAASANHRFIRHTGTAQADFGGVVGFGAGATVDVLLSRGAANRLDLATGDSFRLVSGSLQFAGTAEQISRSAGELLLTAAIVRTTQDLEIDGDLDHDGTNVGFHGVAPAPLSAAYTPTNVTPDRAYDANATSINEIADVLGTLIADMQLKGLIG